MSEVKSESAARTWMFRVDVGQLDGDQVLDHDVGWRKSGSKKVGHDVDDFLVETRKSKHLLLNLTDNHFVEERKVKTISRVGAGG